MFVVFYVVLLRGSVCVVCMRSGEMYFGAYISLPFVLLCSMVVCILVALPVVERWMTHWMTVCSVNRARCFPIRQTKFGSSNSSVVLGSSLARCGVARCAFSSFWNRGRMSAVVCMCSVAALFARCCPTLGIRRLTSMRIDGIINDHFHHCSAQCALFFFICFWNCGTIRVTASTGLCHVSWLLLFLCVDFFVQLLTDAYCPCQLTVPSPESLLLH